MSAMRRIFLSEFMFWLVFCGIGFYFVLPIRKKIRFGMDLAGGTYLTVEVQTHKAVEAELVEKMKNTIGRLEQVGKVLPQSKKIENEAIVLMFDTIDHARDAALFLKDDMNNLEQQLDGVTVNLRFSSRLVEQIKNEAVIRNRQVIKTRLDPYGTAEVLVARQGKKFLIIELPDTADPLEAKNRIGKSAQLDFRLVEKMAPSKEDIEYEFDEGIPDEMIILEGKRKGNDLQQYYLVTKFPEITGKYLKESRPSLGGDTGLEPAVSFKLNNEGARKFYELTSKNIGRYIAIVLDNVVISVGRLKSAIRDTGQISGGFRNSKETRELALLLQSGAFIAPVTFEEERRIGPQLGQESINKGLMSCLVGLGLVFLFALLYYKISGLFAFIALLYNLALILIGLACFKATLTLPGIAGMVLTVGMAIDASILIFERIKEELSKGIALHKAVDNGFAGAMRVILDANITTFIVGIVLYYTGTGPIKGFAVTMMLGIISTLITGLFFLRSLFKFVLSNFNLQRLGI